MRHKNLAVVLSLALLAGCTGSASNADLVGLFGDAQAAWDEQGYEDYTVRYSMRTVVGDDFRVVEIEVAGSEAIACSTEGDWDGLGIDPVELCTDPAVDPTSFVFSLLGPVDAEHLTVSLHDAEYYYERVEYDDPDTTGEERLITVLRLDAVPTGLAHWRDNGPSDYRIIYSVRNLNGIGGGSEDGVFDVTVREGRVVECVAEADRLPSSQAECSQPVPDPISVLFSWLARFNPEHTTVDYHAEWQFPTEIDYDDPDGVDEEHRIRVHRFEVLDSS